MSNNGIDFKSIARGQKSLETTENYRKYYIGGWIGSCNGNCFNQSVK